MSQIAFGQPQIKTDTIVFRWKEEVYEFPCAEVVPDHATYNGYFYEAKVSSLRKLARKADNG